MKEKQFLTTLAQAQALAMKAQLTNQYLSTHSIYWDNKLETMQEQQQLAQENIQYLQQQTNPNSRDFIHTLNTTNRLIKNLQKQVDTNLMIDQKRQLQNIAKLSKEIDSRIEKWPTFDTTDKSCDPSNIEQAVTEARQYLAQTTNLLTAYEVKIKQCAHQVHILHDDMQKIALPQTLQKTADSTEKLTKQVANITSALENLPGLQNHLAQIEPLMTGLSKLQLTAQKLTPQP